MLSLDSDIDVSLFFKWWWQQLSFLVPQKFLEALARDRNLIVVEVNPKTAKVSFIGQQEKILLGEFAFDELAKEELQTLIASQKQYSDARVILRIPEKLSVKQDVFLPSAAEDNLEQVMSYELDRYTPFNAEQVYFDFIKLGPANNKALTHLLLVLVKKPSLDHDYQQCMKLGLQPFYADSEILPVNPDERNSQYNLLPQDLCRKANKKPLYIMLAAMLLTMVLFIALMVLPVNRAEQHLSDLKQRTRKVEKTAQGIENSKKSIDYLFQATQVLIDKKKAAASVIELMDTVTKVFGDNTWVSHWRFYNNTLQLTGQSGSASNLIASLEKTKIFKNTKFISPVTKDRRSGLERFKISTQVIIEQNADAE